MGAEGATFDIILIMATLEDVRRIALSLPKTSEEGTGFGVKNGSKSKGFAWSWMERVDPKKPKMPNLEVLAIRTVDVEEREMLIAADPKKFFTEPHYKGFPAVLVRLENIECDELAELLTDGWRCQSPKKLHANLLSA
jgi:hypothetical protein